MNLHKTGLDWLDLFMNSAQTTSLNRTDMEEIPEDFQEQEVNHEMVNNTECSPNGFPGVLQVCRYESAAQRYTATRLQAGFPDR